MYEEEGYTMANRLDLQSKFEELLGSTNVYYDPPSNIQMKYDAIRYSKRRPDVKLANDKKYKTMNSYEVIVISRKPDHPVIEQLTELPYCSYDRHYVADNLHHDVLTIYY